jgi:hypothetical protein
MNTTTKTLLIITICLAIAVMGADHVQPQMRAAGVPSPVQITSVRPILVPSQAAKAPAAAEGLLTAYEVSVSNTSAQNVIVLALEFVMEDANGAALSRNAFSSFFSAGGKPAIAAGAVRTIQHVLAARPGTLKPRVDVVLLSDGSAWGNNASRAVERFTDSLAIKRSAEKWILSLLESDGLEKTKETLRQDLAKEVEERKYSHPKWIGR